MHANLSDNNMGYNMDPAGKSTRLNSQKDHKREQLNFVQFLRSTGKRLKYVSLCCCSMFSLNIVGGHLMLKTTCTFVRMLT